MALSGCPGQDRRFWKPDDVFEHPCPRCGAAIEFWKDDPRRRCGRCGASILNPRFDMGCAKWCAFAEQCLGISASQQAEMTLCDALIEKMKEVFGTDQARITHALTVLDSAEQILKREPADPLVVRAAAVLHDVGIPAAEARHGSAAGKYQEQEGPPIAREILRQFDVAPDAVEHVCRIIANHHSARDIDTAEFRVVWDADRLVNLPEEHPRADGAELAALIGKVFRTETGRDLARRLYTDGASEAAPSEARC